MYQGKQLKLFDTTCLHPVYFKPVVVKGKRKVLDTR